MQHTNLIRFKQCPCCSLWLSAKEIIESPHIEVNGIAFDEEDGDLNLFFFTHRDGSCNTTFTVPVIDFEPFITDPISLVIATGSDECGGHCTDLSDLRLCGATCRYAPYRRFLRHLINVKSQSTPAKLVY